MFFFFKSLILGGKAQLRAKCFLRKGFISRGKMWKLCALMLYFICLDFLILLHYVQVDFFLDLDIQTIWKNINLRVWIIEGRNPLGYVRVATTASEQPHMTFFFANTKLCFVFKSSVNACSCSGLAFEVFTFKINKKFSIMRNDWLNAWMAGFKPESRSCFAICDSTKSHYVFQLVLSTRCLHADIIFLASDLSDIFKAQH